MRCTTAPIRTSFHSLLRFIGNMVEVEGIGLLGGLPFSLEIHRKPLTTASKALVIMKPSILS
ncbi:MAG: hypothetical protein GXO07_02255 [Crenarchaeota archaeon]|nr:hypothetical protein [Thermoproteota archaeon]